MVQPAVTPAKPAELVQELPPLKLTQMMDIGVTKLPLIKVRLGAKKEWPRAMYTPSMQDIEAVVLNLHDEYSLSLNCFKEVHEELGWHGKRKDEDTGVRMTVAREEDIHVTVGRDALHAMIQRNDIPAKRLAALYQPYMVLLHEQGAAALAKFLKTDHSLPDSHAEIQRYLSLAEEIRNVTPDEVVLNLVAVSTEDVKKALSDRAVEFASLICRKIASDTREISSFINTSYGEIGYKVSQKPTETDALVKLENYFLHEVSLEQGKLVQDIRNFQRMWHFLVEHDHLLPKDDVFWLSTSHHWPTNVQKTLEAGGEYMIREKARAEEALRRRVDDFNLQLDRWKREVDNFAKCNFRDSMGDYAKKIKNIKEHLKGTLPLITDINTEGDMLGWEPTALPMVREVADQLEPYDQLCTIAGDFDTSYKSWMTGIVVDLNAEEIEEKVLSMWRTMYKIQKNFPEEEISMYGLPTGPRTAASTILGKLDDFKKHLPVLAVMCNPGYRDRHYAEISEIVGFPLSTESTMSLESVLRHNLSLHLEKLSSISEMATKEYSLEKALDKMLADWEEIDFEILPHRASGTYILGSGGIDEVQQMLDDHIVKTQTMFNSAVIRPFVPRVRDWESQLVKMRDTIEAWLSVQASWLYLEPIFGSDDIMKQMPMEGTKFRGVDTMWREIMADAKEHPGALAVTQEASLLGRLQDANVALDQIQAGLNQYLETKRLYFPRFFFLSNDELLEILAETKDPLRVQPHLKKIFEGINRLEFHENLEIVAMYSSEKERVPLATTVNALEAGTGAVERWLLQVEQSMRKSVQKTVVQAVKSYYTPDLDRTQWVLDWPGQVVLCVAMIAWTSDVTQAIQNGTLDDYARVCSAQLEDIVRLVRGELSPMARQTLGALVVLSVHARDVVAELARDKVSNVMDFAWMSQLRYYFEPETDLVKVSMVNAEITYGYEYLGNSGRLVITPLTDRCYRTLMGAYHLNLGGAPRHGQDGDDQGPGQGPGQAVRRLQLLRRLRLPGHGQVFQGSRLGRRLGLL